MTSEKTQQSTSTAAPKKLVLETITLFNAATVDVNWVEINSPTGHFVIAPNHTPTISLLKPNSTVVYETADGLQASFDVPGGYAVITRNSLRLMAINPVIDSLVDAFGD